jgi:hypothetical protein
MLCSETFVRKSSRLLDNVGKYCRAGQATYDSMAHAVCMLDTKGYKLTLRICNTYYFSTSTKSRDRAAMLRHTCSARLDLYDSFTEFYANRSNGLVVDTVTDGRTEEYCLDRRRSLLFVRYIQVVRRIE